MNKKDLEIGATRKRIGDITLQRLRIFWAVVHNESMTKAAKQIGLTQPSLSQQIAGLEAAVGTPLFERRSNRMLLTEAGTFLLRKAEQVLRDIQELEDGLSEYSNGTRVTIRIAGLSTMLRLIVPQAAAVLQAEFPEIEFDIHNCAPSEVLDMLYGRRANIGLLNASSVARAGSGFIEFPLLEDPYVLVVPKDIELENIHSADGELSAQKPAILARSVRFSFGSRHTQRVQEWYDETLPGNRPLVHTRNYEDALAFVQAGLGVCLAPALACLMEERRFLDGVRLYHTNLQPRQMVVMVPSQYQRLQPYGRFLDILQQTARSLELPAIAATPPFMTHANYAPDLAGR